MIGHPYKVALACRVSSDHCRYNRTNSDMCI